MQKPAYTVKQLKEINQSNIQDKAKAFDVLENAKAWLMDNYQVLTDLEFYLFKSEIKKLYTKLNSLKQVVQ